MVEEAENKKYRTVLAFRIPSLGILAPAGQVIDVNKLTVAEKNKFIKDKLIIEDGPDYLSRANGIKKERKAKAKTNE